MLRNGISCAGVVPYSSTRVTNGGKKALNYSPRDKNEGAYRVVERGEKKSPPSDPRSESRLQARGRRKKKKRVHILLIDAASKSNKNIRTSGKKKSCTYL